MDDVVHLPWVRPLVLFLQSSSNTAPSRIASDVLTKSSEERWRSEGIQIGGVQSARGVMGTWFDKYVSSSSPVQTIIPVAEVYIYRDFDEHGPAGPTCFWKYSDGFDLRKARSALEP